LTRPGNLYGTTLSAVVAALARMDVAHLGAAWRLTQRGNLFGTTSQGGGAAKGGTIFKLVPEPNGKWKESVLHRFARDTGDDPFAGLTFDASGNLYGTATSRGSADDGVVFKLARGTGGAWTYSVLKTFEGKPGTNPYGGLVLDAAGKLYGTTLFCANGQKCRGEVFEVTP